MHKITFVYVVAFVAAQASQTPDAPAALVLPKHSFVSPFLATNAFTGYRNVDEWDIGGSSKVFESFVRITPEHQGSKGWITNRNVFTEDSWSLVMELRATGASPYLYGDGLAIWLVEEVDTVEGPVFGRQDFWKGLGIFFDTFQNMDHSHHHKHPYIYAVVNDGTMHYIPDADKPEPGKQALPGAAENSGCSFDFRYHEVRTDVSVLNHTRVHMWYKNKVLKLRVQQTSDGESGEWYDCFEMKDVEMPKSGFWGVSSATGDLVDNHDIIQFTVRSLSDVDDATDDYSRYEKQQTRQEQDELDEHDLKPGEGERGDFLRVTHAQAAAIDKLNTDVYKLKQQMEFQLASLEAGVSGTRKNLDEKTDGIREVSEKLELQEKVSSDLKEQTITVEAIKKEVEDVQRRSSAWGLPFWILFFALVALAGIGYNRYRKITKSHFL